MPDRNLIPNIVPLSEPVLLPYQCFKLNNGIEVIYIQDPSQNVFKMDVIFEAGVYYQSQPLLASTAINMLNEGTRLHSAEEIADIFDFYGAYTDFYCGLNKSELSLISLCKYARETITMLVEMLTESVIPEKELDIYLTNKHQEFRINNEKTAFLTRKKFSELLFGPEHPYANQISDKDFTSLSADKVRQFYHQYIHAGNCRIMICGNVNDTILQILTDQFSRLQSPTHAAGFPKHPFQPAPAGHYHVEKNNAVQSSLRIGKNGIRLTDPDYAGFMLLNTILGGYFGSRLMSNIREDKGYTYGIHSFNISMPQNSYWCIATDINNEYVAVTIEEIFKEIRRLQAEPVPEDELMLVKNFLYGDLLRELDGVFAQSDALKHKLNYERDNQIYLQMIQQIKACTAADLLVLAHKYLNTDEMYIVTAGK